MDPKEAHRLRALCTAFTNQRTAQLFDAHRRSSSLIPRALATGVFVTYRGRWMLFTASHVLDSPEVQERGLYAMSDGHGLIDLGDFSFVRTGSQGDRVTDDDMDLAILFLDEDVARTLQTIGGFAFTELVELTASPVAGPGSSSHYLIHGYPLELVDLSDRKRHVTRTSLAVFLSRYDEERGVWPEIYDDAHLDLDYEPGLIAEQFEQEEGLELPHPSGFSGCGLWQVSIPEGASGDGDVAILLAGIVHRFNGRLNVLRATRLEVLLHLIHSE